MSFNSELSRKMQVRKLQRQMLKGGDLEASDEVLVAAQVPLKAPEGGYYDEDDLEVLGMAQRAEMTRRALEEMKPVKPVPTFYVHVLVRVQVRGNEVMTVMTQRTGDKCLDKWRRVLGADVEIRASAGPMSQHYATKLAGDKAGRWRRATPDSEIARVESYAA